MRAFAITVLAFTAIGLGAALGATLSPHAPSRLNYPVAQAEIDAIADMVCREARGEPWQGQMAVAYVVANRQRNPLFPLTIEAVLRQPGQFVALADARHEGECARGSAAWRKAQRAAAIALTDGDLNHGATFFDRCDTAPRWMREKDLRARIGAHCFWGESDAVRPR